MSARKLFPLGVGDENLANSKHGGKHKKMDLIFVLIIIISLLEQISTIILKGLVCKGTVLWCPVGKDVKHEFGVKQVY